MTRFLSGTLVLWLVMLKLDLRTCTLFTAGPWARELLNNSMISEVLWEFEQTPLWLVSCELYSELKCKGYPSAQVSGLSTKGPRWGDCDSIEGSWFVVQSLNSKRIQDRCSYGSACLNVWTAWLNNGWWSFCDQCFGTTATAGGEPMVCWVGEHLIPLGIIKRWIQDTLWKQKIC